MKIIICGSNHLSSNIIAEKIEAEYISAEIVYALNQNDAIAEIPNKKVDVRLARSSTYIYL